MLALVALLAGLGILLKLAFKPQGPSPADPGTGASVSGPQDPPEPDESARLLARYRGTEDEALAARVLERFGNNAIRIEESDGIRGLRLLDRFDLEAILLYEGHRPDFRALRDALDDEAAAAVLLHWKEYFGARMEDEVARTVLIGGVTRLSPAARKAASEFPNALPLLLADPEGVTDLIRRWSGDREILGQGLAILALVDLDRGPADLRTALRTLEARGPLAIEAFRLHGAEGFALVSLYGEVLDLVGPAIPLNQLLVLLRVNSEYIDEYLRTHRPEALARHLQHVAASNLTRTIGGNPNALQLLIEYGDRGERALVQAGPDAAGVVYESYQAADLRRQAVESLAEHGMPALVLLDKYAPDPDFREILRRNGAAIIPPIARADAAPEALAALAANPDPSLTESLARVVLAMSKESGQATIALIKKDGLGRVESLSGDQPLRFYQFLPLYDVIHLGGVLARGHAPTGGEYSWALIDGAFVVADALSLLTLQPGGTAAVETTRQQLKAATKGVAREVVEGAGELAARRAAEGARWWAVRRAGGIFDVLSRTPEAIGKMSLEQATTVARPVWAKAGLRLTRWASLTLGGAQTAARTFGIPPQAGLKYVAAQCVQASVGVVGVQKMEEYLQSRRALGHPPEEAGS